MVNDFLKESSRIEAKKLRIEAKKLLSDKFLDGVVDELNLSHRIMSGTFKSRAFLEGIERTKWSWREGDEIPSAESERIREFFKRETSVNADSKECVSIIQFLDYKTRFNYLEIHGIIKDATVKVRVSDRSLKGFNTFPFDIHYKYSQREAEERGLAKKRLEELFRLKVGDFVVHKDGHPLRSGASEYPYAVVSSLEPFILKSEAGDMTWAATVKEKDYMQWVPF